MLTLYGRAAFSITDPLGRTIRFNSATGAYDSWNRDIFAGHELLGVPYGGPYDLIEIPEAVDGEYLIEVIGQETDRVGLFVIAFDAEEGVSSGTEECRTTPGSRTAYVARYSTKPGVPLQLREVHETARDSVGRR